MLNFRDVFLNKYIENENDGSHLYFTLTIYQALYYIALETFHFNLNSNPSVIFSHFIDLETED